MKIKSKGGKIAEPIIFLNNQSHLNESEEINNQISENGTKQIRACQNAEKVLCFLQPMSIMGKGCFFMILLACFLLSGCINYTKFYQTEVDDDRYRVAKMIYDDLESKDMVIYEVYDVILNNPKQPESYTVTANINGKTEFVHIDIENPKGPSQCYISLAIGENGLNYIEGPNKDGYRQYIEITKNGIFNDYGNLANYLQYSCKLFIRNLNAGENKNGKYPAIKAENIGE